MYRITVAIILCAFHTAAFSQQTDKSTPGEEHSRYNKWKYSLMRNESAGPAIPLTLQTGSAGTAGSPCLRYLCPSDRVIFRPGEYKYGLFLIHQPTTIPAKVRQHSYPSY